MNQNDNTYDNPIEYDFSIPTLNTLSNTLQTYGGTSAFRNGIGNAGTAYGSTNNYGISPSSVGRFRGGALANQNSGGFLSSLQSFLGNSNGRNTAANGLGYIGAGLQGIAALGSYRNNNKALKLAKQQFKFSKDFANTNLNNQIQSYNTALYDRAVARAVTENRDLASAQEYYDKNKLSR